MATPGFIDETLLVIVDIETCENCEICLTTLDLLNTNSSFDFLPLSRCFLSYCYVNKLTGLDLCEFM